MSDRSRHPTVAMLPVAALAAALAGSPASTEPLAGALSVRPSATTDAPVHPLVWRPRAASVAALESILEQAGYKLDAIRSGDLAVPRIILAQLPTDLGDVATADVRKELFVSALLPLILVENERILRHRDRVVRLRADFIADRVAEMPSWLLGLLEDYDAETVDQLLLRLDAVPPSLALAQAALESGWGTSRFVESRNALFGVREVVRLASGQRAWRLRSFSDVPAAVRFYVRTLNIHPAYAELRRERARLRREGRVPGAAELSAYLDSYSERGRAYGRDIARLAASNDFVAFDDARLTGGTIAAENLARSADAS